MLAGPGHRISMCGRFDGFYGARRLRAIQQVTSIGLHGMDCIT